MAKARRKRPRQKPLPGLEEQFISAIDDAAATYMDAKTARVKLTNEETEAKNSLLERMIEHGKTRYKTADDVVVDVLSKTRVKATKINNPEDDDDGD